MKKQKIFAISVGRSDYDRYYPILDALQKRKNVSLSLVVTESHSNPIYGKTINFIEKKFNIFKNNYKKYNSNNLVEIFARDLIFLNQLILKYKPNKIIVLGDRYEMLIGPITAIPYNIPIIHFFGGAVTLGATDELVRHAITKMSHFHFPLINDYRKRILQLGEEEWRIKSIGMHELSHFKKSVIEKKILNKILNFNFNLPFILFTFHPTTLELKQLNYQIENLIQAVKSSKLNAVITYPNADPKNQKIIRQINKKFKDKKKYIVIKNCGKEIYASFLKYCLFVIGNSSSGIVEAASFHKPAINIGSRQEGKLKPKNVISCDYNQRSIKRAIEKALKKSFVKKISKFKNPYEEKVKLKKVIDMIVSIKNNDKILRKKFKNK